MKRFLKILLVLVTLGVGIATYTQVMLRVGSGTPPEMAAVEDQADRIVVNKSDRSLILYQNTQELARYRISLGGVPQGHKQFEGDEKTPEGLYHIDWRNPNSIAHLSLHISYPNAQDTAFAQSAGQSAGGNIMIHGMLNGWGWLGPLQHMWDWTNGCIAVPNGAMREIWSRVPNGTPILIEG